MWSVGCQAWFSVRCGGPRLADVSAGIDDLVRIVAERRIRSVAVPALGSGDAGKDWHVVLPLIERSS
jgi:hypothetical protein